MRDTDEVLEGRWKRGQGWSPHLAPAWPTADYRVHK